MVRGESVMMKGFGGAKVGLRRVVGNVAIESFGSSEALCYIY